MKLSKHELASFIETVHDFPKKGVSFKDLSALLGRGLLPDLTHFLAESVADVEFDSVGCVEARGFIYGTALAQHLRKKK